MPELTAILVAKHDADYEQRKFIAALEGVDLDKETGKGQEAVTFDSFKDKVLTKHSGVNQDDIASLRGDAAVRAGFGINYGLDYELSPV